MRCSILQLKRATRSSHALTMVSADKRLPFDSQSAQYLFSSSASKELRTVWYLSTSFTDLPVIMVNWFTSSTAAQRSVQIRPESVRLCVRVCARALSRCAALRSSSSSTSKKSEFLHSGMTVSQPTRMRVVELLETQILQWRRNVKKKHLFAGDFQYKTMETSIFYHRSPDSVSLSLSLFIFLSLYLSLSLPLSPHLSLTRKSKRASAYTAILWHNRWLFHR